MSIYHMSSLKPTCWATFHYSYSCMLEHSMDTDWAKQWEFHSNFEAQQRIKLPTYFIHGKGIEKETKNKCFPPCVCKPLTWSSKKTLITLMELVSILVIIVGTYITFLNNVRSGHFFPRIEYSLRIEKCMNYSICYIG